MIKLMGNDQHQWYLHYKRLTNKGNMEVPVLMKWTICLTRSKQKLVLITSVQSVRNMNIYKTMILKSLTSKVNHTTQISDRSKINARRDDKKEIHCSKRCPSQYIILKYEILRFNSFNITSKRGVYFTVHSLGSVRTNCQLY